MLKITAIRQRTDTGRFVNALNDTVLREMQSLMPVIREEVKKAVGTQYYSLQQLKQMGHPYGLLNPSPPLPPGIINRQSGEFYNNMIIAPPRIVRDRITISIDAQSWKRDMLLHPSRMIARPYDIYLHQRLKRIIAPLMNRMLLNISRVR